MYYSNDKNISLQDKIRIKDKCHLLSIFEKIVKDLLKFFKRWH